MRHALGHETMGGEKIAEHDDEIAAERVGGIDHLPHALTPHIGAAGVQVGDHGDREALSLSARQAATVDSR